MPVDSYIELFTTLFGWRWYEIVWDVLADTGVVYIPFVALLIRTWKDAARGGSFGNVHELALRGVELEFYVAIFVALIAGPPAVTLTASMMSYSPQPTLADPAPAVATIASPDSSYGSAGAFAVSPGVVRLPIWWYAILNLSKGINHGIIAGTPTAVGIREVQQQAQLATISDPQVRAEAAQFFNDCYVPARSNYLREKPSTPAITALIDDYGADDPDWMGSHVYRSIYYPEMRARARVAGWSYDPARDVDYSPSVAHTWGQPTCDQWWNDSEKGLRSKIQALPEASNLRNILASATTQFTGALGPWGSSAAVTAEKLTDTAVRKSLSNSRVEAMTTFQPDDMGVYSGREGVLSNLYGAAQDVAVGVGAGAAHFTIGTMLTALKPMLPIIQSVILMVVYAFLPIVVVISGYSLSMLVIGALGIFSISFWTVLWKLAQWLDENMTLAMHPGSMDSLMSWAAAPGGVFGATSKNILLDLLPAALMLGMPALWTMLIGWAGIHFGRSIEGGLDAASKSSRDAGNAGAGAAKKIAK